MSEPRDIAERLRADRGAGRTHWADCEEAAREIEALRAALQTLSNGVLGCLPLMEPLARQEMGNTNYALLIERAEKARALSGRPAPGSSPAAGKEEIEGLRAENERLRALINTPQTADFLEAVRIEAAHQRERWGDAHDRSKSAENWFWLVGYLSGKALRAAIDGNKDKALHHTISGAAALAQWHAAISSDPTGFGVGQDEDLAALSSKEPTP